MCVFERTEALESFKMNPKSFFSSPQFLWTKIALTGLAWKKLQAKPKKSTVWSNIQTSLVQALVYCRKLTADRKSWTTRLNVYKIFWLQIKLAHESLFQWVFMPGNHRVNLFSCAKPSDIYLWVTRSHRTCLVNWRGILDSKHVNNSVLRNCGDFSLLIIVFHVNETIFYV